MARADLAGRVNTVLTMLLELFPQRVAQLAVKGKEITGSVDKSFGDPVPEFQFELFKVDLPSLFRFMNKASDSAGDTEGLPEVNCKDPCKDSKKKGEIEVACRDNRSSP